jgi:hypothetical protein
MNDEMELLGNGMDEWSSVVKIQIGNLLDELE